MQSSVVAAKRNCYATTIVDGGLKHLSDKLDFSTPIRARKAIGMHLSLVAILVRSQFVDKNLPAYRHRLLA